MHSGAILYKKRTGSLESEAVIISVRRKSRLAVHNYKNAQDDFEIEVSADDTDHSARMMNAPRWTKRNRGHRGYKRHGG